MRRLARTVFTAFEKIFLGGAGVPFPPAVLVALWALAAAARIPGAFLSLAEDDIWNLVVAVDGPWSVALGFGPEPFLTNHILYTLLSKLLIKACGHHGIELAYRLPSLLAGAMAMPLAYLAGARLAGIRAGMIASLLFALAPCFAYHALNARGYMLLAFSCLWLLGLLSAPRPDALRLVIACLCLVLSHGLGLTVLGAFLLTGPWLAERHPRPRAWLRLGLCALPAILYAAPIMAGMMGLRALTRAPADWTRLSAWGFLPQWFEANLGTSWLPAASILPALLMARGAWSMWRESPGKVFSLLAVGWCVPLAFAVGNEYAGYPRFAMAGLPAWILLIARGASVDARGNAAPAFGVRALICISVAGVLFWGSKLRPYLTLPQSDYLSAVAAFRADSPRATVLYGVAPEFSTGLSYYCRRYGLDYQVLASPDALKEAMASREPVGVVWVREQYGVDGRWRSWLEENLPAEKSWPGTSST